MMRTPYGSVSSSSAPPPGWCFPGRSLLLILLLGSIGGLSNSPVRGQDAATFFRANCYSCHTIGGGRVTGPDLKDVTQRKPRPWLVNFLQNPKDVIDAGDPYAAQLLKEARGVIMPKVPGMSTALADNLLDLIEKESRLEQSNFPGLQVSDQPISPQEIEKGRLLFTGAARLENSGPACHNCHSTDGLPGLGGGRMGPDLTKVFERLGGRKALSTWLLSPATPTMSTIFRNRPFGQTDIPLLSAYLEDQAKRASVNEPTQQRAGILLLATVGAAGAFVGLGVIWRTRK